ncbi:MAG TPA: universal stress protein [Albitalea sp.]
MLVPIDGGALTERAFVVSVDLARQLGAALVGFIVEPFASTSPPGAVARATDAALQAHAHDVLGRFERRAREAGVHFSGVATQAGEVSQAIIAAAHEHRCEMIVMATHGRGVVGELLWGSITREVMARTDLPVLVLR